MRKALLMVFIFMWVVMSVGVAMAQSYPKVPVLMIHGLGGSAWGWDTMKNRLAYRGYQRSQLFAITMVDNRSLCSARHLEQIHAKVEEIVRVTGQQRVDVIGHSRGGMNLYDYMRYGNGVNRVRNWIAMGSPLAWSCYTQPPPADPTPGPALYTSIYSTTDELVRPILTHIRGARNVEVQNVSHLTMHMNLQVFYKTWDALHGTGLNGD